MAVTLHPRFSGTTDREYMRCNQVIAEAEARWLEVLYLFAAGLRPDKVADRLCLSKKTVDTYKTHLLKLCRRAWSIQSGKRLDYHFLFEKFAWAANTSDEEETSNESAYCQQVIKRARARWLDVLRAFAAGSSREEVAAKLKISIKTVDVYKTELLELCREVWLLEPNKHIDYHFLREKFARYFEDNPEFPRSIQR